MPALQHSFKTLRREWRSGELRLIAAALIVAIAAVTAVTLFTDRVRQAMVLRTHTLLAADLALARDARCLFRELHHELLSGSRDLVKRFPSVTLLDLLERGVG